MLSINIDDEILKKDNINTFEDLKKTYDINKLDFFDYNIIKNDYNLIVYLNSEALNNVSFNKFLSDLKSLLKYNTSNILDINLFTNKYIKDSDLLTLFLKENFFYLDYFTLSINKQKYSLCYLLFVFKILKNKINYEIYYDKYCDKKINKYNKIVYKYHQHMTTKLQHLTHVFDSFIKYKSNKILKNVNNFDNLHFIKSLKARNFKNFYKFNNKNKINYQNDYKDFLKFFERYKSIKNFEKKLINITEVLTFDEFFYNNINIFELKNNIEKKRKVVADFMQYYIYEKGQLLNFLDLGFYLYNINGFENYQQDIYFFFEYKEHEFLNFILNDSNINAKIEFQNNYSILYFHYLIQLFKNFKHYIFNMAIENIVFDDNFIYPNFDNSMNEKRLDFIFHLEHFIKTLKTIIETKQTYTINFINYLILHYGKFLDYNKIFDYHLLYNPDILNYCKKNSEHSDNSLYDIELNLDNIMQV